MRVTFLAVISAIICFSLFLIFNSVLPLIWAPLTQAANTTMTSPLKAQYNYFLWVFFARVFGVTSVLSFISIPIAYFLDSHKTESEQFSYYDNQYLR